jgi:cephalosporin hydroxylase
MDPMKEFHDQKRMNVEALGSDRKIRRLSAEWFGEVSKRRYSYHFSWLGVPIIQFPQDLIALQEIIWSVKPDAVVETGIAHGGSLIFHASMLELIGGNGIAIGVDVDIRPHNRNAIESHPLGRRIRLVQGSSTDERTVCEVERLLVGARKPLVILDSNHTDSHVLSELRLYERFVPTGSYLIVLDTIVDDMPEEFSRDRAWGPGRGPKAAVRKFLQESDRFAVDEEFNQKLLISVAPDGYLRCIKGA